MANRPEIVAVGAPSSFWKSVNLPIPTNAATRTAKPQRSPMTVIVCGNSTPARRSADRRRVVADGTERSQPPLGPHCTASSFSETTGVSHDRQVNLGAKSPPQELWRIAGSGRRCSGTQLRSHSQIDVSIGHSERLFEVAV